MPHLTLEQSKVFTKYFDWQYKSNSSMKAVIKYHTVEEVKFLKVTTNSLVTLIISFE